MHTPSSPHRLSLACILGVTIALGGVAATAQEAPSPTATRAALPPASQPAPEDPTLSGTETIVFLRHGEKPPTGNGQLTPQGLNRALALSKVLPAKFGKPDYLFAPDPAMTRVAEGGTSFFYCRPLATIEPTAIVLGMSVQTPFGFAQIDKLNAEITKPKYANALIFIAWEHGYEAKAAQALMTQYHANPEDVPHWHGADYDSLYVLKLTRTANQPPKIAFTLEHEGLDNLSKDMPVPAK